MKEFIFLFRGGEMYDPEQSPKQWQEQMQLWIKWMEELSAQGKLVGAQPLTGTGKTVTGIQKVVSDGPFMEGKEMVGGYLICKAKNYDEAVSISKGCPIFIYDDGVVEIREIQEVDVKA